MIPLTPARLLDTRPGEPTIDGLFEGAGQRPARSTLTLEVAGRGGVPEDAAAVVINVAAVDASAPGYITAYPCDQPRPTASNINHTTGQTILNLVLAKADPDGNICLYNLAPTDITADITGYIPAGSDIGTLIPARLLDTRDGESTVDGDYEGSGQQPDGATLELAVAGRGGVPDDADAVVINIAAVDPTAPGYITAYPCNEPRPTAAANINHTAEQTIPNLVLAKVDSDGNICLFNRAATDLIADIAGYAPAGSGLVTLTPARLLDTRAGEPTIDGQASGGGQQPDGATLELDVTGRGGVPDNATAVVINVTAVDPTAPGYITAYPCDQPRPTAASINHTTGETILNLVLARTDTNGNICLYNHAATHLTADITGYTSEPLPPPPTTVPTTTVPSTTVPSTTVPSTTVPPTTVPPTTVPSTTVPPTTLPPTTVPPTTVPPVEPPTPMQHTIAGGRSHTCQLVEDGTINCWGRGSLGQLGNGLHHNRTTPYPVADIDNAIAISAGDAHTCALLADGVVNCWGYNIYGQVGDGTDVGRYSPVPVVGIDNATAIAAGGYFSCALLDDSTISCWGSNADGQLGDGSNVDRSTPVPVVGIDDATAITTGAAHACAERSDGTVSCWGWNNAGQLGNGTDFDSRNTPAPVPGIADPVSLDAAEAQTCAVLANGTISCWGWNESGQLGNGENTDSNVPVTVVGIDNAASVNGGYHTCAVLADGSIECWGNNWSGQLGDGSEADSNVPVSVVGIDNANTVAGGDNHTCALLDDGTTSCWGFNGDGQLGDGTTSPSNVPVTVLDPAP